MIVCMLCVLMLLVSVLCMLILLVYMLCVSMLFAMHAACRCYMQMLLLYNQGPHLLLLLLVFLALVCAHACEPRLLFSSALQSSRISNKAKFSSLL